MNNTAVIYDPNFLKHNHPGHPESASRLESILKKLTESGLTDNLIQLKPRPAILEEIKFCHTEDYVERVRNVCKSEKGFLDPDTYTTGYSYDAAIMAVGSLIELTNSIINGQVKNGFALLRPPGHHALKDRAMGFCIFGNVAIAAKSALKNNEIKKVAIVDIDVHHGNGTQALVKDNQNIMYISTHQFPFYPGTGSITEIGNGVTAGTLLNVPLIPGVGDDGFRNIYNEIIVPSLERYAPNLIFVSAGYDAHWDDPLASMGLTLTGYSWISKELVKISDKLCDSKIVFALEGGYNLEALSYGVINSLNALAGLDETIDPLGRSPYEEPDITGLIGELKKIHQIT